MKAPRCVALLVAAAVLFPSPAGAQLAFRFTSTVGDGSFTLDTNHLVYANDNGSAALYTDVLDTFTFLGVVHTNLDFSVFNNSFVVLNNDGFQILVDRYDQSSVAARLEIDVSGNNTVASGITIADLVKVLSNFSALRSSLAFGTTVVYNQPYPYRQLIGTVTSFELIGPSVNKVSVETNGFCFGIAAGSGSTAVVEVCEALATNLTWLPMQTNALTNGSCTFIDPSWKDVPHRFYRVRVF